MSRVVARRQRRASRFRELRRRPDVHGRLEILIPLPPIFLRLLHGGVRILDPRLCVQPVVPAISPADNGGRRAAIAAIERSKDDAVCVGWAVAQTNQLDSFRVDELVSTTSPSTLPTLPQRLPMVSTGHAEGQFMNEHMGARPPPKGHSAVVPICLRSPYARTRHPQRTPGRTRSPLRTRSRAVCDFFQTHSRFLFRPFGDRRVEKRRTGGRTNSRCDSTDRAGLQKVQVLVGSIRLCGLNRCSARASNTNGPFGCSVGTGSLVISPGASTQQHHLLVCNPPPYRPARGVPPGYDFQACLQPRSNLETDKSHPRGCRPSRSQADCFECSNHSVQGQLWN